MAIFSYRARDKSGAQIQGKVEAGKASAAAALLREKGLVVVGLGPERLGLPALARALFGRVGVGDVANFTRQLATMITAGLPITDALVIIRGQSKRHLSPMVSEILADVEGGSSLSGALARHPSIFSPVYLALVRAGEAGGVLDEMLTRLADNLEKQREFQSKVKGALVYPVIIILGMVVVSAVMMIFVIPKLSTLYGEFGANLPVATRILITISGFISRFWFWLLAFVFGLFFALRVAVRTPQGRLKFDELKLKLPIVGPLLRQILLTEFTRTLGLLVGAGVSILEGLRVSAGVVANSLVATSLARVSQQVEKGFSLAYALGQETHVFPAFLAQMLAVGEETGKLDEVLGKISHIFEQESEQSVKTLTVAIEPLIMVVLGLGVGFLVIAIILPIYNLTSQF